MLYFCLLWLGEKAKGGQKKRWFTALNALYYSFCASQILYNYARNVIRSKKRMRMVWHAGFVLVW